MQKFKVGDKVRIINYGHEYYIFKKNYSKVSKEANRIGIEAEYQLMWGKPISKKHLNKVEGNTKPSNVIAETDDYWVCDSEPTLVGKTGIIQGSYHELYGSVPQDIIQNSKIYALLKIKGKSAWYNEDQLELIV